MPNNILITPGSASIQFSGSAANTIRLQVENSGSIAFYGNSGSLFGITDQLSGSLMSVNDISGLPILEVFSDDRVVMGSFNKNTLVVTGSRVGIDKAVPTADLDISGSVFITGSLRMSSGGITGSLFGTSSVATTASFATSASAADSITFIPPTASFATSASYALSASYAPSAPGGGITSLTAGDGLTGGTITSTGTITVDTGSAHFLDGVKKELNTEGVISSSAQVSYTGLSNIPSGIVSSSSQINTGSFTGSFTGIFTGSLFGTSSWASNAISASFAPDTTFPYTGNARITGSLAITGSVTALSASISSSGPQAGLYLFSSSTQANLTIVPEFGQIRYYSNGSHTFRVGNVDAISISAFSIGPSSDNASTIGSAAVRWKSGYINNIFSSGSIVNTGSLIIRSGSITFQDGGITGSLLGTASNAISSSYAVSASYAPSAPGGGITSLTAGDGLTGGIITSTGTITLDTGSIHFLDGVKKELNTEGVVSSSTQVSYTGLSNVPSGIVSSSTFTSPSQGTVRATINNVQTDVDTGLQAGDSPTFTGLTVNTSIAASIISSSTITGSHVQLVDVIDTTSANKVLVLNTATNKIFTTSSILPNGLISSSQQFNSLTAPFTGSFTGSFSGSLDRFSPVALRISVGTTAPSTPTVNDLWVDTN